jgi:hypothetical protein
MENDNPSSKLLQPNRRQFLLTTSKTVVPAFALNLLKAQK